jgi:hypothetical protein
VGFPHSNFQFAIRNSQFAILNQKIMPTLPPVINYFNPSYRQDQQSPITIVASNFSNHRPLWEAVGLNNEHAGTFQPRLDVTTVINDVSTTVFTPHNRTQAVKVRVYDAVRPSWTNISGPIAMVGEELSYILGGGVPGEYYGANGTETFNNSSGTDECFIEARASGPLWARSIGLSATPHNYSWADGNYDYALVLGQIGLGSVWIGGTSVVGAFSGVPPFTYQPNDLMRVSVEAGKVCFRKNGVLLYQHTPGAPPSGLQPIVSFADLGGSLTEIRFWQTNYDMAETPMTVWGVLPVCQDKLSEHEVLEVAEVSEAEAQRGQDKVVRYHQQLDKWELIFSGRRLSELQAMRDFRAFHRLHIPFILSDQARGIEMFVVFDTGIKDRLIQSNMFDFSCTVKEY